MDTQRRLELPSLTDAQTQQASIDAGLDCAFVTLNSSVYHRLALLVKTAKSLVAGREDMAASQCGGPEAELEMAHAVLMRAFWDVSVFPFDSHHPVMLQQAACMSVVMHVHSALAR